MDSFHARPRHASRLGWREILSLGGDDDPVAARLRAEQLTELRRALPVMLLTVGSHALALVSVLQRSRFAHAALIWLALICGIMGWAIYTAWRNARVEAGPRRLAARMRRGAACAAAIALLWNAMLVWTIPEVAPGQVIALSTIQLALLAAGAYCIGPAPLAALLYVAIFIVAHGLLAAMAVVHGVASPYVLGLIVVIGIAIARGIWQTAQAVARQVAAREELRERGQMIEMLLSEYERAGADWLWETDAQGLCKHLSPRFAEIAGRPVDDFIGKLLFDPGQSTTPGHEGLARAVEKLQPFRGVEVGPTLGGEQRWWSLSGTPRFDGHGRFAGFTGVGSDVTEQRRARAQIERMATSDGLTGLANRAAIRGHIQSALDAVRCGGSGGCAVMMIDLDRFKDVNDTLGHHFGDELLREVAKRLQTALSHGGAVARLGGDEFAVVLSGVNAATARAVGARIVEALSEGYTLKGSAVRIGASVGVAMGPGDGDTIDDILRAADLALYRAKDDGRGLVRLYEPALHHDAEARRTLEMALRGALREDQLSLMFQPIVDLAGGAVVGFEALLRWKHPVLGQVSPAQFIPVAEELGLMDQIGEWVLRQACAWAARWPSHIGISVNLSPSQLVNARLPGIVLHALAAHGIAPERLELEVTENIFLNETDNTRGALDQLARLGVRIGLDDFGTGYSSLGYLRTTVFNTIKIDRCFVRDAVDGSSQSAAIVRHIVGLAASLGMETVAEGAETQQELDAVRALGCGLVQGYFTGRPMAAEDAVALVALPVQVARAA